MYTPTASSNHSLHFSFTFIAHILVRRIFNPQLVPLPTFFITFSMNIWSNILRPHFSIANMVTPVVVVVAAATAIQRSSRRRRRWSRCSIRPPNLVDSGRSSLCTFSAYILPTTFSFTFIAHILVRRIFNPQLVPRFIRRHLLLRHPPEPHHLGSIPGAVVLGGGAWSWGVRLEPLQTCGPSARPPCRPCLHSSTMVSKASHRAKPDSGRSPGRVPLNQIQTLCIIGSM